MLSHPLRKPAHRPRCKHQQQTAARHPSPHQEVLLCEYSNKTLLYTHTHIHVLLYHLWGCTMVTGTAGQLFFSPLLYFVFFTHASFYQKYKLNVNLWCTNVKLYALFNYCGCVACQHFAKEFKLLLQLTKYKLKWTETELHVMKHSKCVKKKKIDLQECI